LCNLLKCNIMKRIIGVVTLMSALIFGIHAQQKVLSAKKQTNFKGYE
jgi:hypothetical protein